MTHDNHSSEPVDLHQDPSPLADDAEAPPAPARKAPPRPPMPAATRMQPSWVLSATGEQLTRDEILARYRRQRAVPEDPVENAARQVPPPDYQHGVISEQKAARFRGRTHEPAAPPPDSPRSFSVAQTFAIAAATALVAGGSAGVLNAYLLGPQARAPLAIDATGADLADAAANPPAIQLQMTQSDATRATTIEKKPVSTATLQVADVTGETNSFIPLALHAEPAGLETDMLLKIAGLPEGAYLTSGHRQDDKIWALSLAEMKDVKLVVPQADNPQIDLAVAAFEPRTGELAAPVKTMTVALKDVVVAPASAPPPGLSTAVSAGTTSTLPGAASTALPVTIPPPFRNTPALAVPETDATQELIDEADEMLGRGDVAAARRNYERAWGNDGSAAAAFGLARSYDPLVLPTLPATTAAPDKSEAMHWYQRASAAGHAEAATAITRLQMN